MIFINKNVLVVLLAVPMISWAGPHTAAKNKACPGHWEPTNSTVPVIFNSTEEKRPPWGAPPGTDPDEWADSANSDRNKAKAHIDASGALVTTDPTFSQDIDLLTVASECLMFRNFEVGASQNSPTEPTPINTENGWMRAVIF